MKRECENYRLVESVSPFAVKLMNLLTQMERYLEEERNAGNAEQPDAFMELFFRVRQFLTGAVKGVEPHGLEVEGVRLAAGFGISALVADFG